MQLDQIKRREFITLLGGAAAWPLSARAQQSERMRRIGVLMNFAADDAEGQVRLAAFLQGLQETGWAVGRNVRINLRWGAANNELYRKYAAELVALAPDVILASATPSVQALQHANRTVPVVFAMVGDPVGMGRQHHHVQAVLRHVDTAKREHGHLRIPSLLMRARALATVRVWKKRPEHQAHSRFGNRGGCGLPVTTGAEP